MLAVPIGCAVGSKAHFVATHAVAQLGCGSDAVREQAHSRLQCHRAGLECRATDGQPAITGHERPVVGIQGVRLQQVSRCQAGEAEVSMNFLQTNRQVNAHHRVATADDLLHRMPCIVQSV
jgi:hypothetical protein